MNYFIIVLFCLSSSYSFSSQVEKYAPEHMDQEARDYFLHSYPRSVPGKVCGKFLNESDCIFLHFDRNKKGVISLDLKNGSRWINLYKIAPPSDIVFIVLADEKKKEMSSKTEKRDEVVLYFYGKSALKFYFSGKKNHYRWISD
jgi:hypothetical protein